MENFIVSARKYRPQNFRSVVGQPHISGTLKNAIKNNHLAQAFLFCGPRGVGKTTCARILAKTINCTNRTSDTEACNTCESCLSFNSGASLNVYELDAASNNSVDDIRALVDQVRFAPQLGDFKVYIIDEVHMLSNQAFNAFLKTLEEPPKHAIFILATTEKHKIIPTILSRCQIFDFNRIKIDDIAKHLQYIANTEHITADPDALHVIAQKADGALRDACSIFDQIVSFAGDNVTYKAVLDNLHVLDYDYYFKLTDVLFAQNTASALLIFDDILQNGFDGHQFLVGLGDHFRNLLVCKDESTLILLEVGENVKEKYKLQGETVPTNYILRCLGIINKCDLNYKNSKNQRLQVEIALLQMASIIAMAQEAEKKKDDGDVEVQSNDSNPQKPLAPASPPPISGPKTSPKTLLVNAEILSQLKGGVSIKPAIDHVHLSNKDKAEIEQEKVDQTFENQYFSQENLVTIWKQFADLKRADKDMNFAMTLSKHEPKLMTATLINYEIDNDAQVELLRDHKKELLDFLRINLKNRDIAIDFVMADENQANSRLYSPSDKFKFLAEKNPALLELQKRLDLNLDF